MILREGQQVRVKNYSKYDTPKYFTRGMLKYCGKKVTIKEILYFDYGAEVYIKEDPAGFVFSFDDFELIHSFKSLLQTGRIVENRYGVRRLVVDELMIGTADCLDSSYYDDSLEHISRERALDIVAVYVMDEPGSLDYILSHPGDCIWRRGEDT